VWLRVRERSSGEGTDVADALTIATAAIATSRYRSELDDDRRLRTRPLTT